MSKRDPFVLLEDIMLAIQKIGRYTSQLNRDAFLANDLVIDGVARNLEIIGEATRQLPGRVQAESCRGPLDTDRRTAKPNCARLIWSRS